MPADIYYSNPNAAQALKGLRANEPLDAYLLQKQRQSELEDRVGRAERNGVTSLQETQTNPYGVWNNAHTALQQVGDDLARSPVGPASAQAQEVASSRASDQAAIAAGFGGDRNIMRGSRGYGNVGDGFSPTQRANEAGRAAAQYKVDVPVRAAEAAGATDVQKQGLANQGALGVQQEITSREKNNPLLRLLDNGIDPSKLKGVTIPHAGGVTFQSTGAGGTKIPAPILTQIAAGRAAVQSKGEKGMFGMGGPTPEKTQLDQSIANALTYVNAAPEIHEFAKGVADDPTLKDMSLDDILAHTGEDSLTPEEKAAVQDYLYIYRGH